MLEGLLGSGPVIVVTGQSRSGALNPVMIIIGKELVLFSVLSGLVCHSWLLLLIVTTVLVGLMTRPNGMFYIILAISALWAFMPFCWGLAGGGWPWALIVGGIAFWMGIKVHINGLKWYWDEVVCKNDDVIEWKRMGWCGPNASKQPF